MTLNFTNLVFSMAKALDWVENALVGITTNHGKRIACISTFLGEKLGMSPKELSELICVTILHDCAITEYLAEEYAISNSIEEGVVPENILAGHCIMGEKIISRLPFSNFVRGAVLHHHENANGSGPLGKTNAEISLPARIIHIADNVDIIFDLSEYSFSKKEKIALHLQESKNSLYDPLLCDIFLENLDEIFNVLSKESCLQKNLADKASPIILDLNGAQLEKIADVFAAIIDYKSPFTKNHSHGLAKKIQQLGKHYNYSDIECQKLYLAAAIHDVGKLCIPTTVLEKADKLTSEEFTVIKHHALASYEILAKIDGLEDVCAWACNHHEKLDGTGYPFGKTAEQLSKKDRLLACLDIYQALTEPRPYKEGMPHATAIKIIEKMAKENKLDKEIIADIGIFFGKHQN